MTFDPVIVLLGIYPKGLKTYVDKETCTSMSIAVLFIISKTQKQSRYPSVGGQKTTIVHPAVQYHWLLKRNQLSSHEKAAKNLNTYY